MGVKIWYAVNLEMLSSCETLEMHQIRWSVSTRCKLHNATEIKSKHSILITLCSVKGSKIIAGTIE